MVCRTAVTAVCILVQLVLIAARVQKRQPASVVLDLDQGSSGEFSVTGYWPSQVSLDSSQSSTLERTLWPLHVFSVILTSYCLTAHPPGLNLTPCPVQRKALEQPLTEAPDFSNRGPPITQHGNLIEAPAETQVKLFWPLPVSLAPIAKTTSTLTVSCIPASLAQTPLCPGCASNSQCPAAAPYCHGESGVCQQCLSSSDCPRDRPVCSNGLCAPLSVADSGTINNKECSTPSDCPAAKPVCKGGVCFKCSTGTECPPKASMCDAASGTCKECLSPTDCPPGKPACKAGSCSSCTSNNDCPSGSSKCQTGTGVCKECLSSADCPSAYKPACKGGTCSPCSTNGDCPLGASKCQTGTGVCKECLSSADCPSAYKPACKGGTCSPCSANGDCPLGASKCQTGTGTCKQCLVSTDCPATAPVCKAGSCSPCVSHSDCPAGTNRCQTGTGMCQECLAPTDCPSAKPACRNGTCSPCSSDGDCPLSARKCDTGTSTCRACLVSSDCPTATPNCNAAAGLCYACTVNSDCPAASPICDTPQCYACPTRCLNGDVKMPCYERLFPGSRYCFSTNKGTMSEAYDTCEAATMKLAALQTKEEADAIEAKLKSDPALQSSDGLPYLYFLGGTSGSWMTDEPYTYNHFVRAVARVSSDDDCTAMSSAKNFFWIVTDCEKQNYFICEAKL